jgi:hypothetical protein
LGSYKELLDLIEAKAWRVNELVILIIHLAEVTEDVVEVLTIDIRRPFSNRRHSHVEEIRTCALRKMADSNSVYLLVGFNFELKRDYDPRLGKGRTVTPRTVPLMLRALSHLLRCSAVGAFTFR